MSRKPAVDRRSFLKGAAVTGAAALVPDAAASAAPDAAPQAAPAQWAVPTTPPVGVREVDSVVEVGAGPTGRAGSDFMLDVLKSLDFEYVASNAGSSFRGIHESIINYGNNQSPEFLTCCHEESSVAMAHGYYKVEGKPMAALCHGTVGLQHATMAVYNAYCDRVPVFILAGNHLDAAERGGSVEWQHSVQDAAALVRDFVKWDDTPASLGHFAESAVRAYKIAMTPPMGPVVIVIDAHLQEDPLHRRLPAAACATPRCGDSAQNDSGRLPKPRGCSSARRTLSSWRIAPRERWQDGPAIELARRYRRRSSISAADELSSRHPLNWSEASSDGVADVILGLGLLTFRARPGVRLISIGSCPLHQSNYQTSALREGDGNGRRRRGHAPGADRRIDVWSPTTGAAPLENAGSGWSRRTFEAWRRRAEAAYTWDVANRAARLAADLGRIRGKAGRLLPAATPDWVFHLWNFAKPCLARSSSAPRASAAAHRPAWAARSPTRNTGTFGEHSERR